jgi:hypothetical protein
VQYLLRVLTFVVLCAAVFVPRRAWAHPTPGSVVFVDFGIDEARLVHDAPVEELERAMKAQLFDAASIKAETVIAEHGDQLKRYAAEHLRATTEDGRAWRVDVRGLEPHEAADGPRVKFLFELAAPPGAGSSPLHLHDDMVLHEVVSHYTTVYARRDWALGITSNEPRLAGALHFATKDIVLVRAGNFWRGLGGVIRLGMDHIATGTDHLLFLFMLIIATPMVAERGRWGARRDLRSSLGAILRVVTAFTIGHSITLSLAALGFFEAPSTVVESAVSLSILATAVHALRPWFPRGEALLAAAFGLVHGLAFASTLAGTGIGGAQLAWSLVGFNLGIELAQIVGLALVVPWVLLLATTSMFTPFRKVAALAGAMLATAWFAERAFGVTNPTTAWTAVLERHPLVDLAVLAGFAIAARLFAPERTREAPAASEAGRSLTSTRMV